MGHGIYRGVKRGVVRGVRHVGALPLGSNPYAGRDIIVIAGQSNANGFAFHQFINNVDGYASAYPNVYQLEKLATTNGDPLVWTSERGPSSLTPVQLSPRTGDANGSFGLELSCMRYMDHAVPQGFHVVKMAVPGASLATNWKAVGSTYPTTPPRLITQFINYLTNAQTVLGSTIACIIWQQGENDCTSVPFAAAYETNLKDLIDAVRVAFPGVPWVVNRLHSGAGGSQQAVVRAAQAAAVAAKAPATLVDLDPLAITTLHFNPDQYVAAGRLDAIAALGLLGILSPPFADFRWFGTGLSIQFTDLSLDGDSTVSSWTYDFGDGNTSFDEDPVHVYAAPGTYTVSLTVVDDDALPDTIVKQVTVANNAWAIDATSGKAVPNTSAEWTAFIAACGQTGTPTALWRMQEASGVLADSSGTVTLTPNGSPLYNQAVVGWTRTGVKGVDGTSNQRFTNSTTAPNPALTSTLVMGYVALGATPAATRDILGTVGNMDVRQFTGGKLRIVAGATADLYQVSASTVQPVILRTNITNQTVTVFTEQERFYGTYVAPTSATQVFFMGQTAAASASTYMYGCEFAGAAAEKTDDQIRIMLRTAGWNPAW